LFDEKGRPIAIEEMATGLHEIINKYMKMDRKLSVSEQISIPEREED